MDSATSILDVDRLLAPVSEDRPAGEDLRESSSPENSYQVIKTARKSARSDERRLPAIQDGQRGDIESQIRNNWRTVFEQGQALLASESKDLEVSAWLIEAAIREHGFAGLRSGLRVARELVEQYWEQMFPARDESEGLLFRVAALRALNGEDADGTLLAPINNAPIFEAGSDHAFSHADCQAAQRLEGVSDPERRARQIEAGTPTLEQIEQLAAQAGEQRLQERLEHIRRALEEVEQLDDLLREKCAEEQDSEGNPIAPQFGQIREALRGCEQSMLLFYSEPERFDGAGEDGKLTDGSAASGTPDGAASAINAHADTMTRDQAFQVLLRVADFFRRTEPHSPIPYALEQVVRWGRMPAPKLWTELIGDESEREKIFRLLGMPVENKESE